VTDRFDNSLGRGLYHPQIFGMLDGGFRGFSKVSAYKTTPTVNPGLAAPWLRGGPVGASDYWNGHFVEAGPQLDCDPFCYNHPYWSYGNKLGTLYWDRDTSVSLTPGGNYYYSVASDGRYGTWSATWCGSYCKGLASGLPVGEDNLPFAVSGGEEEGFDPTADSFGSLTTNGFQPVLAGDPEPPAGTAIKCYDRGVSVSTVGAIGGTISPCFNGTWTVNYTR
jgi:hypothetical protein